jgi:hypothetical protein
MFKIPPTKDWNVAIIVVVAIVLVCLYWWSLREDDQEKKIEVVENNYNIFGESKFDTIVKGYLEVKEKQVFDSTIPTAYFVITEFADNGFRESLEEGISQRNTVNMKENDMYKFNLGCFGDGKIEGIEYEADKVYIDESTQEKIIGSSLNNQVSLVLSFGYHLGRGCDCCNLAHSVRISD